MSSKFVAFGSFLSAVAETVRRAFVRRKHGALIALIRGAFMLLLGLANSPAQVVINEFVAAPSTRLLHREPGVYPCPGITTPWIAPDFDDSQWAAGPGPLGFGTFSGITLGTELSGALQNRGASLYVRRAFQVSPAQAASAASLDLVVRHNDGFIAFLNGVEVARHNLGNPGTFVFHDQNAHSTNQPGAPLVFSIGSVSNRLQVGENVLCLQVHNQTLNGTDGTTLLLEAELREAGGATLVAATDEWKYFPGLAEPSGGVLDYGLFHQFLTEQQGVAWATRWFNDSSWSVGAGPVGMDGDVPPDYVLGVNLHGQMFGLASSSYTRCVFAVSTNTAVNTNALSLTLDYDDGVIVYLNGREVARRNVGTTNIPTAHHALADAAHNANGDNGGSVTNQQETLLIGPAADWLAAGDNVLAVQLHNQSLTSADAIARVTLSTTGPGAQTLVQPGDNVRYFVGTVEPGSAIQDDENETDGEGALPEAPDAENDWVELYNPSGSPISLAGWSLTDNALTPRKWMFPTNTVIAPGGYLLVLATDLNTGPDFGSTYLHANFSLSADGEYLGLVDASGTTVSELSPTYPPQSRRHSFGRDSLGNWAWFALATPGRTNSSPPLAAAPAAPTFSVPGGFHDTPFNLTLTSSPGATIRYTLDGSEPDALSALYTAPLAISTSQVVRARAESPAAVPSATVTHTYLLGQSAARKSLPAMCINGNPKLTLYGPNAANGPVDGEGVMAIKGGIYVNNFWQTDGDPATFNNTRLRGRAMEKPASLEYFPTNGTPLRTGAGLRISSSTHTRNRYLLTDDVNSRFTPKDNKLKPSFNLFFRSEFGTRPLEYPFFTNSPVTRFNDVRVRAGKNDNNNPFIKDEFVRRLFLSTGQKGSIGTFNTLYLNGVFKGYYNLCERLREGFMQAHYNSTAAWDVQQLNEFASGDPLHWNQFITYLRTTNLATLDGYQGVHSYLDVDNYIDYIIVNAFAAMWDWPNNNWVAARERTPQGRWRFYLWDAEGAFGANSRNTSYNTFTNDLIIPDAQTTTGSYIPALYTLLRVSPEFRLRFADRAQKHFFNNGGMVKTNMESVFVQLRDTINPIMQETIGASLNQNFYNTWIASDTRRSNFFNQLTAEDLWSATQAPLFSHYGGTVTNGFTLTLTNPNASGTLYFTTNGIDPRAPGGGIAGSVYTSPLVITATTTVKARVRSTAGVWSPSIEAVFVIPPPLPTFLPSASGDWTTTVNWSTTPQPYPNAAGGVAVIPPPNNVDRNVNLRAPVTITEIQFPQSSSTNRNRVRDQSTGNTLTFAATNGSARLEVGGTNTGYVEFEVLAGTFLQSDLRLHVTNILGHPDHGALRLRANWSGPGGLIKSGAGIASLSGAGKTFTGETVIEYGVLAVTAPATPTASPRVVVQPGGQLRLTSGDNTGNPPLYSFGGPVELAGVGRGPEIPERQELGILGALRYEPGGTGNQAIVTSPILLTAPTDVHVGGASNEMILAGPLSGSHSWTKSGGGNVRLAADNSAFMQPVQIDNGGLILGGSLGSPVQLGATAFSEGYGAVQSFSGTGTLRLNQILQATSASGLTNQFVFTRTGSPLYLQTTAPGNGVLRLSSAPVAPIQLDCYLTTNTNGTVARGGYFVPFSADLANAILPTPKRIFVPNAAGPHFFAGQLWSIASNAVLTTVAESANFGQGIVNGRTLEIRIGGSPTTFAAWQLAAFPNPADRANPLISGPAADPLNSGLVNLVRYALGLGLTETPVANHRLQFVGTASAPVLRFPFDSGRNDLAWILESSALLTDWNAPTIHFDSRSNFPTNLSAGLLDVAAPGPIGNQRLYRLRFLLLGAP